MSQTVVTFPMKRFGLAAPVLGAGITAWTGFVGWRYLIVAAEPAEGFEIGVWLAALLALCWATCRSARFAYGSLRWPQQFIRLEPEDLVYRIYPESGKIAYRQIRMVEMTWRSNRGQIYKGRLHLYYLPDGAEEDMANYRHRVLKLDYLQHPDKRWWHYMQTDLYLEMLTELERQLADRIPDGLLHSKLEYEKYRTRVWLGK
ncbi:hypothetical protein [Neisseria sp. CCUG12390]|uniref:hypothetical protein n=1 Tax=Neisseria sp. CCUG12390 TaxID=3392035 RepID=UPI003A0FBBC3